MGILLSNYFVVDLFYIVTLAILLLIIAIILRFVKSDSLTLISNIVILFIVIISGYTYHTIHNLDETNYPFSEKFVRDALIDGRVTDIQLPSNDKLTLEIETKTILKNEIEFAEQIKLLCNFYYKDEVINEIANDIEIGNRIVVLGNISIPPNDRNPGDFDYRSYLFQNGVSAIAVSYSPLDFIRVDKKKSHFKNFVYQIRLNIHNQINEIYSPNPSGLLKGLLLADRSEIGHDIREGFVQSGVVHVLAVSGLHVGYIIIILLLLTGRLNIYLRFSIITLGLIIFVLITNHPPSVTRASIMSVLILISYLRSNRQNNFNTLAFAAFILLLFDPNEIFNPGFQLSFSAVLSIFIFFPVINNYVTTKYNFNKMIRYIILFIGVSFAAQIGTIPFTIYYFEKLSLVSLGANLFVIPLIGLILALGIWTLLLSYFSSSIAYFFVLLNEWLVNTLYKFVAAIGDWEFSHLYLPHYSIWDASVYFLLLGLFTIYYRKFSHTLSKIIFVLLLFANLFFLSKIDNQELLKNDRLNMIFVDVGDGEATIAKLPGGENILINSGGGSDSYNSGERIIIPLLNVLKSVELIIVSLHILIEINI
ncbi:MAG: ComEC/Rec2 family competence protein [Melioribacteraceae bacterium]|nr:ComEC/Rec2 family competence protein [Melioribacteraceae bacterium]